MHRLQRLGEWPHHTWIWTVLSHLTLQVFQANNDATEVVLNKLHTPLLTRFVRVRPQTWHSGIALRLELFGCRVTGEGDPGEAAELIVS